MIPGLRQAAEIIHAEGVPVGIQLFHAGRQTSMQITGQQPVAPSEMPSPLMNELPRALSAAEIRTLVEAFGTAAARALS